MKGFTLLEILVAVFMTGILMAGLYGAYTSNIETIQRARHQGELYQTARIILDLMCKDLESAFLDTDQGLFCENREIGGRPADRLGFATLNGAISKEEGYRPDLKRVAYYGEENSDGMGFVLYRSEEGLAAMDLPLAKETQELTRVAMALDIAFEDRDGRRSDEWLTGGEGENSRFPPMVHIGLTLRDASGREQTFRTGVHLPQERRP
ncbi:MAG: prepilin-type N-terminal cleavage/methylation domain-containing protein [Deltaproteobacteria bacterium]|nr:prepilin-type N-terminal cleavage/methylation domain-containing protein [Deltaproteobacteria bacterium]